MKKYLSSIFLAYLKLSAKIQLWKIKPKIIALTGSVGKTSLRNAIWACFKNDYTSKKSVKANSETGIPLDILSLHVTDYSFSDWLKLSALVLLKLITNWQKYDYYIVELGIDDPFPPKNMDYLLSFIKPDVGIFLNVTLVHSQQFEKILPKDKTLIEEDRNKFLIQAIASEKGKILTKLESSKTAIANADCDLVYNQAKKSTAKKYFFGYKKDNFPDLLISDYKLNLSGTNFSFTHKNKKLGLNLSYLLPKYYGYTLGAALLAALSQNIKLERALNSLRNNFVLPPGRMSVFKGIKKTTIIDSSYNASKMATLGAIEVLTSFKNEIKVFIFGDMRELGSSAKIEHEEVAQKLIGKIDLLVLIGPQTKKYVYPVVFQKIKTVCFDQSYKASAWLKKNLAGKETILIKGSQNAIFTEIVVEALLYDKNDISRLCRRGKFWDKKRKELLINEINCNLLFENRNN